MIKKLKEYLKKIILFLFSKKIILRHRKTREKIVSLTFDDGPHPKYTQQILDILKKHNAAATFFMIGQHAAQHPEIVKQIAEDGHELGNHSLNHNEFVRGKLKYPHKEMIEAQKVLEDISKREITLFRPPYGILSLRVMINLMFSNMKIVMWTIDSDDWKGRAKEEIIEKIFSRGDLSGHILLFHDRFQVTVETLEELILKIKKMGYEFVTVSSMIASR